MHYAAPQYILADRPSRVPDRGPPFSVYMYLSSLPEIGRSLDASVPQVQLTLSAALVCFAIGQIVYGPISDQIGRKPVLVAALAVYAAASFGCAFSISIEMLIAFRSIQAIGLAGAPLLARAIVRDLYQGDRAGRELSLMGSILALAPVIAPAAGGLVQVTSVGRRISSCRRQSASALCGR